MQPTELHLHGDAFSALAILARSAVSAGVPQHITPTWTVVGGFADGQLRSDDDTALLVLDAWRRVLGPARVGTTIHQAPDGPRRVYTAAAMVGDVHVRLVASVPAAVAPRREAVPA